MRCRKALRQINARMDGELPERFGDALEDHLAECEGCRAVAADFSVMGTRLETLSVSEPRAGFTGRLLARIETPQSQQDNPLRRWFAALRPAPVGVGLAAFSFGVLLAVLGAPGSVLSASATESDSALTVDGFLVTLADEPVEERLLELLPILEE